MAEILDHLAFFLLGFMVAFLIMVWVLGRYKQDWDSEYRRLMAGIDGAMWRLKNGKIALAMRIMQDTYDDVTWPRR